MTELDFFGHFGYFFLLMGLLFIGAKERVGWFFRLFGEMIWIGIGLAMGMTSIWMWGLIFMAVDVYNFEKWRNERLGQLKLVSMILDEDPEPTPELVALAEEYKRMVKFNNGTLQTTKFGLEYDLDSIEYHGAMTRLFRNEAK